MALTAFTRRMGIDQGRVASSNAKDGSFVFALGSAFAGHVESIAAGDFVEVKQPCDLTGMRLVRAYLDFTTPAVVAAGFTWKASLRVDGTEYASYAGRPGRQRKVTDIAASVSGMTGMHDVAVRLQLVAG